MSDILIRNVPEKMKNKLKARAKEHHRSVSKEIYTILEESIIETYQVRETPKPYKGKFKVTDEFISNAKNADRR
ncbi:MAG: Arc family DNA-binding protein [Candidatus Marinimicrobia bacterium]|jgi:plasmid stability protein|nr:hypothetical protein [Candidatus Neomarinimicrobiota bacterium]MDP6499162.1 Arc family DNA-binding protein [Candidatus Neomarinimicrobiota bacterium]MDP6727168.1 Arc family DNA-binding protein [Candidatus Neomarinimicrobiota bacterium]|tara:strand:- start:96 stop:317 length:222 start_codon:yes stop_codon:yes gene_type:complete